MKTILTNKRLWFFLGICLLAGRNLYAEGPIKRLIISPLEERRDAANDKALPIIKEHFVAMLSDGIKDKKYVLALSERPQLSLDITVNKCHSAAGEGVKQSYYIHAMGLSSTDSNASLEVTLVITDIESSVPLDSQTFSANASTKDASGFFTLDWKGTMDEFRRDTPIGFACQRISDDIVDYLLVKLNSVPWQGTIKSVDGNDIVLEYGDTDGLRSGNIFKVFKKGESTYQSKLLGGSVRDTLIEVFHVEEDFCVAHPAEKGPFPFSAGDIVQHYVAK